MSKDHPKSEHGVSFEGSLTHLKTIRDELIKSGFTWDCFLTMKQLKKLGYVYLHTDFEGETANLGMRNYQNDDYHYILPAEYDGGLHAAITRLPGG